MTPQSHPTPFPAVITSHTSKRSYRYHPHLDALREVKASGVYAIIDARSKKALYVGESHTGRLFDTITRHFRQWKVDARQDAQGRRMGGTMYDRRAVNVMYVITDASAAQDNQYAEIQRLKPRDNFIDGVTVCCDDLPI